MEGKKKILLIDDEIDLSDLLAKRIRAGGYEVVCYHKGESAIDKIHLIKPDLILLDIKLPDVSGYEIFEALRQDERLKKTPVVFLSALHEEKEYCLKVLKAGGFVPKPTESKFLIETIRAVLAGGGGERA